MGYTHYFYINYETQPPDAFGRTAFDFLALREEAEHHGIEIVNWAGEQGTQPEVTEGVLSFNGFPGCETFQIKAFRHRDTWLNIFADRWPVWPDFVKTRHLPYDAVVVALLCRMKIHYGDAIDIGSDGWWDGGDHDEGRQLYRDTFGTSADCPFNEQPAVP